MAVSQQADQERNLLFNLRSAFVQTLQAKPVLALAKENLAYFDRELGISRGPKAGDIARVDLDRWNCSGPVRVGFRRPRGEPADGQDQLLQLLNDRTPLEQFDVTGPFEFAEPADDARRVARKRRWQSRPDLKAAMQRSTRRKPTIGWRWPMARPIRLQRDGGRTIRRSTTRTIYKTLGASVSIPLRIFDRNQGEKARTEIDIGSRAAARRGRSAGLQRRGFGLLRWLNGVESARAVSGEKDIWTRATSVRDTISFSYQHGGASLVDFLDAQRDYRAFRSLTSTWWARI